MPQKKKSSSAKGRNTKSTAKASAAKKPKRREIGALVCLFLAVFSFLGYFPSDGVFIRFLSDIVKGFVGWGFNLLMPALLFCSFILAFHRGRPVSFRVVSTLLVPVLTGAIYQLFFDTTKYTISFAMFKPLWASGRAMTGGGVLGGALEVLFGFLFSKAGAAIVFIVGLLFLLMSAFNVTVSSITDRLNQRERLEYELEPIPDKSAKRAEKEAQRLYKQQEKMAKEASAARPEPEKAVPAKQPTYTAIDIPIDEPLGKQPEQEFVRKKTLFNKNPNVRTPDQFIQEAHGVRAEKEPEKEPEKAQSPRIHPGNIDERSDIEVIEISDDTAPSTVSAPIKAAEPKPMPTSTPPVKPAVPSFSVPEPISEKPAPPLYIFPPLNLLASDAGSGKVDSREEIRLNKERLEISLRSFGINSAITNITRGPSVTRYEMELEAGVKLNKLTSLSDDIALSLGASGVRIAAIPNRISTVGIEVPNKLISKVYLRDIIDTSEFKNSSSKLTFAIGKNISGEAIIGNISKLPHLLVAGTTGSGKSVCLNSMILSIMYKSTPEEVKFIMIDPKMVEFKIYNGIPHLLVPVVTEAKKASGALQWAVTEMMKRYRLFSELGARDLATYNDMIRKQGEDKPIPQIIVVIDELADLMLIAAKEVEESVCRIAQMGRAAGVHLVIATQSPRADVITGLMKANIPSRIALKVSSSLESRIILDAGGNADKLVGNGDMLFAPMGTSKPVRVQGTWVSDEERESIVEFIKKSGTAEYAEDVIAQIERAANEKEKPSGKQEAAQEEKSDYDELLPQAVDVIFETAQASVSMLQRRLKLGYARAARLVDQMEEIGIVGPFEGSKPRQILITKPQWQEMQLVQGTAPLERDIQQNLFSADELFTEDEQS